MRTLKSKLSAYGAAERSLSMNLKRRMADLENDMKYSTVKDLSRRMDLKKWLIKMMHNSFEIYTLLSSIAKRDRTFSRSHTCMLPSHNAKCYTGAIEECSGGIGISSIDLTMLDIPIPKP